MSTAPPPQRLTTEPRIFFTERGPLGISFTERMSGAWSPKESAEGYEALTLDDYEGAYRRGMRQGRRLELVLTIRAESLAAMLHRPNHEAEFVGTATLAGVGERGEARRCLVTSGVFRLFVGVNDMHAVASRTMTYDALLTAADGRQWMLTGFKAIRHGGGVAHFAGGGRGSAWGDQTRLFFELTDGTTHALGILTLSLRDFLRQLRSIRAVGALKPVERCDTIARFLVFFFGVLRDTYGGPLARSRYAPPNWWRRTRRPLEGALQREPHPFSTSDGVELRLTRYCKPGRARRAVILAPGLGVRADSFAIDTVDRNIVEALCADDYDVWLFDYRGSPELDASRGQYSIDDIALIDWPRAVAEVRRLTDEKKVDVIAHCVGSMSFMMAALGGKLRGQIGSAVCSQVGAHPIGTDLNKLKAISGLGYWLQILFGVKAIRVTVQAADTYRRPFLDRLLKLYPTDDWCDNPVCSRIRFVFGESYLHANLNRGTHDAVIEMFGNPGQDRDEGIVERFGDPMETRLAGAGRAVLRRLGFQDPFPHRAAYASLRALRHLSQILTAGRLLTEDGEDTYLMPAGLQNLDFRLGLMSGRLNHIFPPQGIDTTLDWLTKAREQGRAPNLVDLAALHFEKYAHMDCFIGVNAHADVFPALSRWLSLRGG